MESTEKRPNETDGTLHSESVRTNYGVMHLRIGYRILCRNRNAKLATTVPDEVTCIKCRQHPSFAR